MIQDKENIDYYNQRMVFAGKEMDDSEMIGAYGVSSDATIEVLFKMAGGVIEPTLAALAKKYNCEFDDRGNIGKRYRRQDEIGTPFCVTYDFESENDGAVTVRDRDTMEQERIKIEDLDAYFAEKFNW